MLCCWLTELSKVSSSTRLFTDGIGYRFQSECATHEPNHCLHLRNPQPSFHQTPCPSVSCRLLPLPTIHHGVGPANTRGRDDTLASCSPIVTRQEVPRGRTRPLPLARPLLRRVGPASTLITPLPIADLCSVETEWESARWEEVWNPYSSPCRAFGRWQDGVVRPGTLQALVHLVPHSPSTRRHPPSLSPRHRLQDTDLPAVAERLPAYSYLGSELYGHCTPRLARRAIRDETRPTRRPARSPALARRDPRVSPRRQCSRVRRRYRRRRAQRRRCRRVSRVQTVCLYDMFG